MHKRIRSELERERESQFRSAIYVRLSWPEFVFSVGRDRALDGSEKQRRALGGA